MALRDVRDYFFSIEKMYIQMKNTVERINEELSQGNVTEEEALKCQGMMKPLLDNYNRVAYIMYLFQKPGVKSKSKVNFSACLDNYFKEIGVDKEAVYIENEKAVSELNGFLEEVKSKNAGGKSNG